jgi:hypothetical protein
MTIRALDSAATGTGIIFVEEYKIKKLPIVEFSPFSYYFPLPSL